MTEAARHLSLASDGRKVTTAIILGTGLGAIAGEKPGDRVIAYSDLPGFPQASVSGHAGRLVLRETGAGITAFLLGRAHYYEEGDPRAMAGALETLAALGVKRLILTCASGSTRPDMPPGSLVLLRDHINMSGANPLIGVKGDGRFVPMVNAYDPTLRAAFKAIAKEQTIALPEGVYMWFSGPSFETPAEIRMASLLGADLAGMSTVPEVILARHLGLSVAALSVVTNFAAGFAGGAPNHEETKRVAASGAQDLSGLISAFLEQEI